MDIILNRNIKKAFSLVEIMLVLVSISIAMAAFLPIVTKRVTNTNNTQQFSVNKDGSTPLKFGSACLIGNDKECVLCEGEKVLSSDGQSCQCPEGYSENTEGYCEPDFECDGEFFVQIGNLCVFRYNIGDAPNGEFPLTGANSVNAGSSCASTNDTTPAQDNSCCWYGAVSGTNCDNAGSSDYGGCDRTVCNWGAANHVCSTYTYGNKVWRLPTKAELKIITADISSIYQKASLGYCANGSVSGYSNCGILDLSAPTSVGDKAYSYGLWSSDLDGTTKAHLYRLDSDWSTMTLDRKGALSARCVTSM